jgi:nickel-dependent lactate racemase
MAIHLALGSPTTAISDAELAAAVTRTLAGLGTRRRVLAIPPDITRLNARAGQVMGAVAAHYQGALCDVLPALGTHVPMTPAHIARMYPGVPERLFRPHRWRDDVVTIGEVDAAFVAAATGGVWSKPWPAQLNRLVWEGGHDLILSVGQVVPHEVMGMANGVKNLFVGCGGKLGIDASHFIGAAYGMERMMGRCDTPVRRILNEALLRFCGHLPFVFILTVVGRAAPGENADHAGLVTRGLFIGTGTDVFEAAAALSQQVNFELLDEEPQRVVCFLDPEEFHTTWLGNKAIYRTRMAIATGGELIVLAPGLKGFGEDPGIDQLIRRYGYRTTPEIMSALDANADLRDSLSAAAHLIHGSSEGRFTVRYCPGHLSRAEIEAVGYQWGDLAAETRRWAGLRDGWNDTAEGRVFYVANPALGLWAWRGRFTG